MAKVLFFIDAIKLKNCVIMWQRNTPVFLFFVFYCFSQSRSQSLFSLITCEMVLSRVGSAEVGAPPTLSLQVQI